MNIIPLILPGGKIRFLHIPSPQNNSSHFQEFPSDYIPIDNNFLIANTSTFGGPPYVLGIPFGSYASSTGYYLTTPIKTPGMAFLVGNDGTDLPMTLGLNGQQINYDTIDQPIVPNAFFGTDPVGTGPTISDWAVSGTGAPTALVIPIQSGMLQYPFIPHFGTQCLQIVAPPYLVGSVSSGDGNSFCTISTGQDHGLNNGDYVFFWNFGTAPDITKEVHPVTVISATGFQCQDVVLTAIGTNVGNISPATTITSSYTNITESGHYYTGQLQTVNNNAEQNPHLVRTRLLQNNTLLEEMDVNNDQIQGSVGQQVLVNFRAFTSMSTCPVVSGTPLQIRTHIGNYNNIPLTIYVGRAKIAKAYCPAIIDYLNGFQLPAADNLPTSISSQIRNFQPNAGLNIIDGYGGSLSPRGRIVQGNGSGFRSHGIQTAIYGNISVRDIEMIYTGDDSLGVRSANANGTSNNTNIDNLNITYSGNVHITDRFNINAACYCNLGGSATGSVTNVKVYNHPHIAISMGGVGGWTGHCLISGCYTYPNNVVPNGYAIGSANNSTVVNNVIDTLTYNGGGRGFYIAAGQSAVASGMVLDGNISLIRENPYLETQSVQPRGIRVRNEENGNGTNGSILNCIINNNEFTAVISSGVDPVCYGAWISLIAPTEVVSLAQTANTGYFKYDFGSVFNVSENFECYLYDFSTSPPVNGLQTLVNSQDTIWNLSGVNLSSISNGNGFVGLKSSVDAMNKPNNFMVTNNTFRAIALSGIEFGATVGEVSAVAFDDFGVTGCVYSGNTYDSNMYAIKLTSQDGTDNLTALLVNETISNNTTYFGAANSGFNSVFGNSNPTINLVMQGTKFLNGANDTGVQFFATYSQSVLWKYNIDVTVQNISNNPISNAYVTVVNDGGLIDSSGYTNSDGFISLLATARLQTGTFSVSTTEYSPHTITATGVGFTGQSYDLGSVHSNMTHTFNLS